jgi:hypothetical protein
MVDERKARGIANHPKSIKMIVTSQRLQWALRIHVPLLPLPPPNLLLPPPPRGTLGGTVLQARFALRQRAKAPRPFLLTLPSLLPPSAPTPPLAPPTPVTPGILRERDHRRQRFADACALHAFPAPRIPRIPQGEALEATHLFVPNARCLLPPRVTVIYNS